ncbi:hypothetical protein N7513_002849 [Penicillium frequentans]|nr:hypothetical protein N7513_002849 [Penicillium glabrum]
MALWNQTSPKSPTWRGSTKALLFFNLLLLASATAGPKLVSLQLHRNAQPSLVKRSVAEVPLDYFYAKNLFWLNATVGTPPQPVQLQIDTGSSDVWVFGPDSCGSGQCYGKHYDDSQSSTASLIDKDGFQITYGDYSQVFGDYMSDNFQISSITIKDLEFAVARETSEGLIGVMGIGFDAGESIAYASGESYKNIMDSMVDQGLTNSRSYSLWLNDLESGTGNILFGGYDTAKFKGNLTPIAIQNDAQSGKITSMTVPWTSLSVTDPTEGTTSLTGKDFTEPALLDSGTSLSFVPQDIYDQVASFANVFYYEDMAYVECEVMKSYKGTLNFGFDGSSGPMISVLFSELCPPIVDIDGAPITLANGNTLCGFGLEVAQEGDIIVLGDSFLRSAYVVYNLDRKEIAIAQTIFETDESNVVEIDAQGSSGDQIWHLSGGVTVQQTATARPEGPGQHDTMTVTTELSYTPTATEFHLTGSAVSQTTTSSQQSGSPQSTEASQGTATSSAAPKSDACASLIISIISLFLGSELILMV